MKFTRAQRYILSSCAGLLLSLAFPFTGSVTPFVFLGFVPLLFISEDLTSKSNGSWRLFIHCYICFLIFNIGTTWWVANASFAGALLAFVLNSLFMSVVFVLFHRLKKGIHSNWAIWTLIPLWISFEYFHFNWDLSWPWLTLGNFFSIRTSWIQWYEYTGVLGGSVWILSVNILVFQWLKTLFVSKKKSKDQKKTWRQKLSWHQSLAILVLSILLPIIISLLHMPTLNFYQGKKILVTVVQPNVDPYNEKFALGTSNEIQLKKFFQLANTVTTTETDLVIGPETAISQGFIEARILGLPFYNLIQDEMKKWANADLLIGASTVALFDNKHSRASQYIPNQRLYFECYNSSLFIPKKGTLSFIHKSKLVPGVEMIPFSNWFPFLEELAIKNGGTSGTLGVENSPKVFRGQKVLAPIICYESIYGEFIAKQVRQGAPFLTVITNDGWWGDTPGYKQHFSFSSLRAIENRRWVVRSANTGKSGVFDEFGGIEHETDYWKEAAFDYTIPLLNEFTFYTNFGDYLGVLSVLISVSILLYILYQYFQSKRKAKGLTA